MPSHGLKIQALYRESGLEANDDEYFSAGHEHVEKRPIGHTKYTHELTVNGKTYYAVMWDPGAPGASLRGRSA
jgi:hypothetical protein